MGLFDFLRKKGDGVKVTDTVWISEKAKWNAILDHYNANPDTIIVAWFDSTIHALETLFNKTTTQPARIYAARETHHSHLSSGNIIFAEHYPLRQKEQDAYKHWQLNKVNVYSSLDEPLFTEFGGQRIIELMKKLGMKEDEPVQHPMITQSISRAQQKIEEKVTFEQTANSQKEWMDRNLPR